MCVGICETRIDDVLGEEFFHWHSKSSETKYRAYNIYGVDIVWSGDGCSTEKHTITDEDRNKYDTRHVTFIVLIQKPAKGLPPIAYQQHCHKCFDCCSKPNASDP